MFRKSIVDLAARNVVADQFAKSAGILCVFQGFCEAELRQQSRCQAARLFRSMTHKKERGFRLSPRYSYFLHWDYNTIISELQPLFAYFFGIYSAKCTYFLILHGICCVKCRKWRVVEGADPYRIYPSQDATSSMRRYA